MNSPSLKEPNSAARLLSLPTEILNAIVSRLPNHGIKNLRLTCRLFHRLAVLRLDRVFLSANPRNIEVFCAVARHEELRKQISEIVWDDARLPHSQGEQQNTDSDSDADESDSENGDHDGDCPTWFARACEANEYQLKDRRGQDIIDGRRPDHVARAGQLEAQMSRRDAWAYYCELLRLQDRVLQQGADVAAFEQCVLRDRRFPSLQRITITPASHGFLFNPLHETPMIRAFPPGFNYPIPHTWPGMRSEPPPPVATSWRDATDEDKDRWRGFRVITRAITQHLKEHQDSLGDPGSTFSIPEVVVNVNELHTGINCTIFDDPPCAEYNDFAAVLRQPNFRRIDLALIVGGQWYENWSAFRSGLLCKAWAGAKDLEHVSLRADVTESDPDATRATDDRNFVPLLTIIPVDKWSRLRHLGLARFLVRQDDVLGLLAGLPLTIRSIELSFLCFLPERGSYKGLLDDVRDTLGWRDRVPAERPRVTVGLDLDQPVAGRAIWVESEISDFLYEDATNPFGSEGWGVDQVPHGKGVVRDAFEPAHERPWMDGISLIRQGYYEWPSWLPKQ
ncbi:hypothetical protein N0V93_009730 [Gnomoniopsis smithogilvyi]|uniref:F-box domain-containing protein n=1 Tax=Gnomoniopsis smithogilvyi TaxID=1191159 RepID=A0A9W9CTY7_9PEZI|nr:hypothetical protein N0V93_009730 [Gnomoniopsis smithogilvyi]